MLAGCLISQNPVKYLADSVEESARSYFSSDANKLYDALEDKGSIEITLSSLPDALVGSMIDAKDIKLKFYYGNEKTAFEFAAQIDGKNYDLTATSSEKEIAFKTSLLDSAYGINLKNAKKNLKNNDYLSGLVNEMLGEDGEDKISVDDLIDTIRNGYNSAEQLKKFAESYEEKLKDIVNKVCDIKKSSEKGGAVVSFSVKAEDITDVLKQLYGEFKKDKKLRSFIEENLGEIIKASDMKIDDLYGLTDEQLQSYADEAVEDFKGYRLEGEVHISSKKIVRSAAIAVKDPNGDAIANVDIQLEGNVKSASVTYNGETYSVSYEIKEDTKKDYKAVLNVTRKIGNTTTTTELGNISYNRENSAYTVVIYADDTPVEIKGTLEVSSSKATFTVTSVLAEGQEVFNGKLSVILNAKDSMPSSIGKYTDILTMKEDDFNALAEKLQNLVPSIELEPDYGYDYGYDYDF